MGRKGRWRERVGWEVREKGMGGRKKRVNVRDRRGCGRKERLTPMHNKAVRRRVRVSCNERVVKGHETLDALVERTQVILCHILHNTDTLDPYNLHCPYNHVQLYSGTFM